ncbi:MAG: ABC transporter permease [Bacteriovoracia bacterium]
MEALWALVETILNLTIPVGLAALGGYFSERGGIIQLGLEGMILISSFSSAAVTVLTHSVVLGVCAGLASAVVFSLLHGLSTIVFRSDQVITGMALNFLALGLTPVLCKALFGIASSTPTLDTMHTISNVFVNFHGGFSPMLIILVVLVVLVSLNHKYGTFGLHLRFSGEHPEALESQGVSVNKVRWAGLFFTGICCGLAGIFLAIDHGSGFVRNMSSGRGFIALAALILARWNPAWILFTALIFGGIEGAQILLQGVEIGKGQTIPVQWIQLLPYAATLLVLALSPRFRQSKSSSAPKRLGQPYPLAT